MNHVGGRHSTEVAFALSTRLFRVWLSAFSNFSRFNAPPPVCRMSYNQPLPCLDNKISSPMATWSSKEQLWDRFSRGDTVSARFFINHILKHRRVLKNDFPPFTAAAYDAVFEASVDSLSICLTENICTATQCLFLKVKLSFCLWLHLPYIHLKHLKHSASLTSKVNHSSKH